LSAFLKPLLAIVISILVFTGYLHLVDTGLVYFIQTRFYNPSIVNSFVRENTLDAEIAQSHLFELQSKFAATLNEPAVRSSFLHNQIVEDIYERSRIFGMLLESTIGLQSVQFVDINGMRIHFSTSARDIIRVTPEYTAYRNYYEDPQALLYELVSVSAGNSPKFTMDEQSDRIIFSFPFNDSMDVYRGTALFNVSIRAVAERLIAEGRLKVSDDISVVGSPPGILLGSPEAFRADIHGKVSEVWNEGTQSRITLDAEDTGISFSLISLRTGNGLFFGRLVNNVLFSISDSMKFILQLSIFLTFFLTFFFLLNLRPNPVMLVRNRIKNLRENLFEQLYVNKSSQERVKWILELEQRRDEIRLDLKRNLKIRRRQEITIDGIIDKSWDELLAVIKSGAAISGSSQVLPVSQQAEIDETDEIEEIEELEDIEEVEELEEIEEAEAIEKTEDVEEAEELEEAEEAEELEEAEEAEEIEEVEEVEEVEDVVEAEELEDAEEVEEADELGDGNETGEVKSVQTGNGFISLANEVEFGNGYNAKADEAEEQTPESDVAELDIVSPLSVMFSSLDDSKEAAKKAPKQTAKKDSTQDTKKVSKKDITQDTKEAPKKTTRKDTTLGGKKVSKKDITEDIKKVQKKDITKDTKKAQKQTTKKDTTQNTGKVPKKTTK
jgi:hypothetical protein